MPEGICSSILQLDPNILCVARMTDQVVEVARRRGYYNTDDSVGENSDRARFQVSDLLKGYQYELTDHESFRRLTFHLDGDSLTADVDKKTDVLSLTEIIAKIVKNQEVLRTHPGIVIGINATPEMISTPVASGEEK